MHELARHYYSEKHSKMIKYQNAVGADDTTTQPSVPSHKHGAVGHQPPVGTDSTTLRHILTGKSIFKPRTESASSDATTSTISDLSVASSPSLEESCEHDHFGFDDELSAIFSDDNFGLASNDLEDFEEAIKVSYISRD
jgi:hypothetical protein